MSSNFQGSISSEFASLRENMIREQLVPRGITSEPILEAFRKVPREKFIPDDKKEAAYIDAPVEISQGQTISQPFTVAIMTQLLQLQPNDKVLEIGSGSGYQAAIIAEISKFGKIYTIERIDQLAKQAESILKELGYKNIVAKVGDGSQGLPAYAPFDAIIVTAGAPFIPEPLISQLAPGGRLVIPVGNSIYQEMTRVTKLANNQVKKETFGGFTFVPLVGKYGWKDQFKIQS